MRRFSSLRVLKGRNFSTTLHRRADEGFDITASIMEELKNPVRKKKLPPKHKIVVLSASETGLIRKVPKYFFEKKAPGRLNLLDFDQKRKNLLVFKSEIPYDDLIASIEEMRPDKSIISFKRYEQIKEDLDKAYTLAQLRDFLTRNKHKLSKTKRKFEIIETIIKDIWKIEKSESVSDVDDLLVQRTIELTNKDLFLLVSQNGKIIYDLMRRDVKIILIADELKLIIRGTSKPTQYVEIAISKILTNIRKDIIDVGELQKLFDEYKIELPIIDLQKITEVYFDKLSESKYELSSLGNKIDRVKRLLLWSLNYNPHLTNNLMLPHLDNADHENYQLMKFVYDESLDWVHRTSNWFRLKNQESKKVIESESEDPLLESFKKFKNKELDEFDLSLETLKNYKLELAANDIIEEGANDDDLVIQHDTPEPSSSKNVEQSNNNEVKIPNIDKELLYKQLTTFTDRKLAGLPESERSNRLFSVTLGDILFKSQHENNDVNSKNSNLSLIPHPALNNIDSKSPFIFNTNIPLIEQKVLNLPFNNPESDTDLGSSLFSGFTNTDHHTYHVQLKFVPCPFTNIENFKKYPPIEMWLRLDKYNSVEIETLEVLTSEFENSTYINLPEAKSDLKVSCSVNGTLIDLNSMMAHDPEVEESDVKGKIEGNDAGEWLDIQPGIKQFLKDAKLNFDGRKPVVIPQTVDVLIGDRTIKYFYLNINYRRQLELLYENQLLQYNMVEGGALGARKCEVNLIGKFGEDMNEQEFSDFIDDATSLIKTL